MTTSWLDDLLSFGDSNASFVTIDVEASLASHRLLLGTAGQIGLSDGGAGSTASLGLVATAVIAGSYERPAITVDAYGRVTAAESLPAGIMALEDGTAPDAGHFETINVIGGTAQRSGVRLTLDGSGYATIGNVAELALDYDADFTICGWFTTTGTSRTIISKGGGGTSTGWQLRVTSGGLLQLYMVDTSANVLFFVTSAGVIVNDGSLVHFSVAYTALGQTCEICLGGKLVSSGKSGSLAATMVNADSAQIGASRTLAEKFVGDLDDLIVYDAALTESQAAQVMAAYDGLDSLVIPGATVLGYWPMRETDGATIADEANGNDATLAGTATLTKVTPYDRNNVLTVTVEGGVTGGALNQVLQHDGADADWRDEITLPEGDDRTIEVAQRATQGNGYDLVIVGGSGKTAGNGGNAILRGGAAEFPVIEPDEGRAQLQTFDLQTFDEGSAQLQTSDGGVVCSVNGTAASPKFGAFGVTEVEQPTITRATATMQDIADALHELGWIKLSGSWPE